MKSSNLWPARKILLDLYEVREEVSPGRYGDHHLETLSKSLRWVDKEFGLSKAELGRRLLFSPNVLTSVMAGNKMRLENFLRLTSNLIDFLEIWIASHPEIPPALGKSSADWRALKSNAHKKIVRLSQELTELLDIVRRSNSLGMTDSILTPELKAQLIALLETALAQLKSPLVEVSLLKKIGRWLPALGKKIGESAGEKAVEKLATDAGGHIIDLIESSIL